MTFMLAAERAARGAVPHYTCVRASRRPGRPVPPDCIDLADAGGVIQVAGAAAAEFASQVCRQRHASFNWSKPW